MTVYSSIKMALLCATFSIVTNQVTAQDNDSVHISVNKMFELAEQQNRQIRLSTMFLQRSELVVADKKNNKLPEISFSASAGYLTNVGVIGLGTMPTDFYNMPHFANSYAIQASTVVYSAGRLNTEVDLARLESALEAIAKDKNMQSIKLVLAGYYLDLYQLYQQKKVYEKNILLAQELLRKIDDRYQTGIALKSDKIRNELLLSNFELELSKIVDRIQILNNNLIASLDLPANTVIIPEEKLQVPDFINNLVYSGSADPYNAQSLSNSPDSKEAALKLQLAQKKLKVIRSSYYPELSVFLMGALNRPYTFDIPAKDIYANNNSVGVKITYPIDNLYNSRKKVEIANKDIQIAKESRYQVADNLQRDVKNNIINCRQAYNQVQSIEKQQELANENYRRISDNYIEQLALNTEVMDASNQKLDADLRLTTAKVQIVFAYYQLLKTLGQL